MIEFDGFDWDEFNLYKNEKKHGVPKDLIEKVLSHYIDIVLEDHKHSSEEERFIAMGTTHEHRMLIISFTIRNRNGARLIRPISARYMHEKERKKYKENPSTF